MRQSEPRCVLEELSDIRSMDVVPPSRTSPEIRTHLHFQADGSPTNPAGKTPPAIEYNFKENVVGTFTPIPRKTQSSIELKNSGQRTTDLCSQ